MNQQYHWIKGIFKSDYHLYSGKSQIGTLKNQVFSQVGYGEINGKLYRFQTKGILHPVTGIYDESTNTKIGDITYNSWMNKAYIRYSGKTANWWYENLWNTRWRITDQEGNYIKFRGSETNGSIESTMENDLLLLTGLFVTNYYWQITIAIIVAVFVPIWITVIN